jgi:hypothetical protein
MTIFAILMPTPQPELVKEIEKVFPNHHLKITETQWLVSSNNTVIDVVAQLGIYDAKKPENAPTGIAIVLATSSYYGRAPNTVWDWMKSNLEGITNG